ncbi:uncharacterized protein LOC125039058 [Penaeus chinensis]|uniref:uncharacterized protein LOC125039058 n=1 Tax=Penaeus chinensis TaxID=139456 RepID=UPI001FB644FA|nr:uncharacterized protein LOC125039058 [Penaeus chinensis]
MSLKVVVLACVAVVALCDKVPFLIPHPPVYIPRPAYHTPEPAYHAPEPAYHEPAYPDVPAKYNYNYGVADSYSGANFAASESRDESEVTYEGEAQYPEYKPTYKPAHPAYA